MAKSRFEFVLGTAFFTAMLACSARAQDYTNGVNRGGTIQGQLDPTGSPRQGAPFIQAGVFDGGAPASSTRFETSAALLFLQPSSGNLVYATVINPLPALSPHWNDQAVDPGFSPAFNVGVRYVWDSVGDVQLAWTHLNTYDGASASAGATQAVGPSFLIGPPPDFKTANAVAHFAYDAVNWDAGIFLNAANNVPVRIFAGLQGARLAQTLSAGFLSSDGSNSFTDTSRSLFEGVGPRLGVDVHYLGGNLDLFAGMAGTALIGRQQSHIDFVATSPMDSSAGLIPNSQYLNSPGSTRVIPGIDAKLGGSYAIPVGRFGTFKCEAGYQAAVYINAVNQYSLSEVTTPPSLENSAVFLRTAVEFQSNYVVHGPYVKFCLQF